MSVEISVVVPVYNVERYIEKCINSILLQSFQRFEIILVDDGSTDGSSEICDLFKNERIKVIHKKNGGLSEARNLGTDMAEGKYVTWIDSDDSIHVDFLLTLYNLITEYQADIAICDFMIFKENEKTERVNIGCDNGVITGNEALIRILTGQLHGTSACGLLLKKSIAQKYQFPLGKYHEDDLTTFLFYRNANKVAFTKDKLYNYLQRNDSIMHKKSFSIIDIAELDAADTIFNSCREYGIEYEKAALAKKVGNYSEIAFKYNRLKYIDIYTYKRVYSFFKTELFSIIRNDYIGKKLKLKIILYILFHTLVINRNFI